MTLRALEFYSGIGTGFVGIDILLVIHCHIGGLHLSLSKSTIKVDVVQAFDWDPTACQVYTANYGNLVRKVLFYSAAPMYNVCSEFDLA